MSEQRELSLYADGNRIAEGCRIRVHGGAGMTLLPDAWQIDLYNATGEDLAALRRAEWAALYGEQGGLLCAGRLTEIGRRTLQAREISSLMLTDGGAFWRATVSLSVRGDTGLRAVLQAVLDHCSSPIPLATFPETEQRFPLGQTWYGRAADAVREIASAAGGRAYVFRDHLYVVRDGSGAARTFIAAERLRGEPLFLSDAVILQTDMAGWPVGHMAEVEHSRVRGQWLIAAQRVSADSREGEWKSELTLVDPGKL